MDSSPSLGMDFSKVEEMAKSLNFSSEEIQSVVQIAEKSLLKNPKILQFLERIKALGPAESTTEPPSFVELVKMTKDLLAKNAITFEDLKEFYEIMKEEEEMTEYIQDITLEKFLDL